MRKQIIHLSVHQTSKVIAAMHTVMFSVLFVLPVVLGQLVRGDLILALFALLIVPFVLWLLLYVGYVVACWFYNQVIPWTGGIEFELADVERESLPLSPTSTVNIAERIDHL